MLCKNLTPAENAVGGFLNILFNHKIGRVPFGSESHFAPVIYFEAVIMENTTGRVTYFKQRAVLRVRH